MEIKGFVDISLVDWDGKVSSVIFLPHCNMRCPYCYNSSLVLHPETLSTIPFEEIEGYLKKNHGWIDGVVITGGEPTIHADLPDLCSKIKKLGFLVKVDTNGTNPTMVKELIDKGLVDYIAMDVKAPLIEGEYSEACGVNSKNLLEGIEETIDVLLKLGVEHEFRTTVVPSLHEKEDIEKICQKIRGCRTYALQNFKSEVKTMNPSYNGIKPFTDEKMKIFLEAAKRTIPNTILR